MGHLNGVSIPRAVQRVILGDPWFRQVDLSAWHASNNVAVGQTDEVRESGMYVLDWAIQRFLGYGIVGSGSERLVSPEVGLRVWRHIFRQISGAGLFLLAEEDLGALLGDCDDPE